MIRSMTGYGMSEFFIGEDKFLLEVKSLNHRFLEITVRIPDRFSSLEHKIRNEVRQRFYRGYFQISVAAIRQTGETIQPNIPLARHYLDVIRGIRRELGVRGEMDITTLLRFKDIFTSTKATYDSGADWLGIAQGLESAMDILEKMREEEGQSLADDIALRLENIEDIVESMNERAPVIAEIYKEKLRERIAGIPGSKAIDEVRLLSEVVLFAEKSSITEEVARLSSHMTQFKNMLELDEPVGRKMDFLCQEVLREINTIGAKANDFELTNMVIMAKAELEKIREQVQNVE